MSLSSSFNFLPSPSPYSEKFVPNSGNSNLDNAASSPVPDSQILSRIFQFVHQPPPPTPLNPNELPRQKATAKALRTLLVEQIKELGQHSTQQFQGSHHYLSQTDRAFVLTTDDALNRLAKIDANLSALVELRYFLGLDLEEVAQLTGESLKTITVRWRLARTWLFQNTRA